MNHLANIVCISNFLPFTMNKQKKLLRGDNSTIFWEFPPRTLGEDFPILTVFAYFFQMGWFNHQVGYLCTTHVLENFFWQVTQKGGGVLSAVLGLGETAL